MEYGLIYMTLAVIFGFFMAWGVGANDVANAMGTSVGAKAITITQAILIAAVFEAAGAMLAGGQVTDTIRSKIIDAQVFSHDPDLLIYGMLAALLAAGSWLLIASHQGWPVSTTHSIVGAMIGFGLVASNSDAIYWHEVINIFLSWVITPVIAGIISYLLFISVQRLIFANPHPFHAAKRFVPGYIFLVAMVICLVTLVKGFKHLQIDLSNWESFTLSMAISAVVMGIGILALRRIKYEADDQKKNHNNIEKIFGVLMVFTACALAFAHGSNDVANAIGPLAAVISIVTHAGDITAKSPLPLWILGLGAAGIVLGLAMYGHRVMATVGKNITQLTPSRGFAAQLATAGTVVVASGMGLPISTTQTLVGAVLGVGLARGMSALNLGVIRNIFMSWVITLPAGAILAIIFYYLIKFIFS